MAELTKFGCISKIIAFIVLLVITIIGWYLIEKGVGGIIPIGTNVRIVAVIVAIFFVLNIIYYTLRLKGIDILKRLKEPV